MSELTLVVLAAGMGSRYGGLKQMEPIGPNGESILDYSIYDALGAGFGRVVFVVSAAIEEIFRDRVGRAIEQRCATHYVIQSLEDLPPGFQAPPGRGKPWGTAHAVWACRDTVTSPFAVINADDFYGRSAFQALSRHLEQAQAQNAASAYCMVGYRLDNTLSEHGHVARGVCTVDGAGYLVEIHERTRIEKHGKKVKYAGAGGEWVELPGNSQVSMNCWGFTPSLFPKLEHGFASFLTENAHEIEKAEFYLSQLVGQLVRQGQATVKVLPSSERWFGVTYQQDMPWVRQEIRNLVLGGVYPDKLWV